MLRQCVSSLARGLGGRGAGVGVFGGTPAGALAAASRGLRSRSVPPHRIYPQWSPQAPQHELWRPSSWLGAYYKLREGDPAAEANQARLKGRRSPSRAAFIVDAVERIERDGLEARQPWRDPKRYTAGDYVQVEHRAAVGEPTDTVVGIVVGVHKKGLGSSFRLLSYIDQTPIEYQFQLYSPLLADVIVRKPSNWRFKKRKLYFLRDRVQSLSFPAPLVDGEVKLTAKQKKKLSAQKKKS
jgi:large subunit ribosomal protein L19